ncbi:MAG TPA: carboxypeptidase regulatory-like domain-containing protein, partial [Pyrinomonadaceae bacterium]|nr:carboxypeptidase regulatory-like domain-containing protein [Pyrinomonadaceae bacterium]
MRLTKKSTRNALVAALMTATLIFALSTDGVVTSAQSGFEGDYDLSFATNGYYVDPENVDPAAADEFQTLFYTGELLPDGSIIAGGRYVNTTPSGDFYLRKFNASGAVVTTFGSNGLVRTNFNSRFDGVPGNDTPSVLKVQPDGKILFAGQCTTLEPGPFPARAFGVDACVLRYNANGTLDQTFGGGTIFYTADTNDTYSTQLDPGKTIFQTGTIASGRSHGTSGIIHDMAIQPDGKIVLVGETRNYYSNGDGFSAIVVRLNPNGSLDSTFGVGGIARWAAPEGPVTSCYPARRFYGMRLQADGRIIAVGHDAITRAGDCFVGTRFVVTRWTAAGQLETVKYIDTLANVDVSFTERAVSAHYTPDGSKLIVSGSSRNRSGTPAGRQKPTMVRLNAGTLALDTTFGSGGIAQYDRVGNNNSSSTVYVGAIQPDGKILGTDNTLTAAGNDNVVRFNSNGTIDQSFGNFGIDGEPEGTGRLKVNVTHYNGASSPLYLGQILVRPNGRINLVGTSAVHAGLGILRAVVSQQNTELPTYTLAGRVLNGSGVGVAGVTVNLSGTQSASKVTDASGNYSFANLPMGGSFTVTPAKAGLSFVPPSKSFTNLSADQLSVNFSVPSLSVNNITVTEGNTGETTATFTVRLQPASTQAVTVKYATA